MPPRPPINPEGYYHVGSRGSYGRTLFETSDQHERFLDMYGRVARKYGWLTPAWALVMNHHHFVIKLTAGGLSEGMRELHGGYSRWIHIQYGQTRQGHLFRHGFFARELQTEAAVVVACVYVDLNPTRRRPQAIPETPAWSGYRATLGLERPRPFHNPAALLELVGHTDSARAVYQTLVHETHAFRSQDPSPNDGLRSMVRSRS
jgi:REP element-mobilizing transposase RayT